ncbi:ROK family protein [Rhodococcus sp. TAF43]|uniref:ROK family protein n=1 Tax=unclassified Rhodococcus (in: high G+C Gram-positive bacteria) TaxID=192944 RepID=UPI001583F40B|nr:ROK family protein [Rhodococcus sp. W8901]QKT12962.1 ROK family transcriptional regulator [Rhodococcus sp. W8901]
MLTAAPHATRTRPVTARTTTSRTPRSGAARPATRPRIVAPTLGIADSPAAAVFRVAAGGGPLSRDEATRATGSSIATVNRHVSAMLAVGLLRERPDLAPAGTVGRPRIPFEVDHESYLTVGIHIGAVVTSVIASDLRGRILGAVEIPTPRGASGSALASITGSARSFAARWHRRRPLWVGVALGGRVDPETGVVDHPRLGWTDARVGDVVGAGFGLPVSVAAHVEAMAASELLLTPQRADNTEVRGSGLYFYARETVGLALTLDGKVHTPSAGPGSIAHLPTGSDAQCDCGATGCLEAAVSDRGVLLAARRAGVLPGGDPLPPIAALYRAARAGSAPAQEILTDRARTLGRAVAMLRDLFNPDRVILGGQAFTDYPEAVPQVAQALSSASRVGGSDVRITGFGNRVQEHAAGVVSLSSLYSSPLTAMRKATVQI